jgi:hypothetical protein
MARPKKTEHRRGLLIKLFSQEKEIICQQAHLAGLTVSKYIRRCALNRPIRSQVSREVAAGLSKLFGLQKHLLMEIKSLPNEEELRRELNAFYWNCTQHSPPSTRTQWSEDDCQSATNSAAREQFQAAMQVPYIGTRLRHWRTFVARRCGIVGEPCRFGHGRNSDGGNCIFEPTLQGCALSL